MKLRTGTRAAAAAVAVLLVAGACGASGDAGVETPSATSAPPPAAEPAPEPPEPPADPDPAPPPEPAPQPAPAESAAPPEAPEEATEPEPPAVEPPAEAEPGEEPATPAEPPDAPAAAESQEMSGELLDEATVTALATRLVAAQATVTSTQMRVYMSIAASFPGEPPVVMEDVPLMTITDVGDLSHVQMDTRGLFAPDPGAAPPDTPSLEMILEGETGLYLRLESLAASDPTPEEPWLAELAAEHGDDFGDLWGFVDLAGADGADALALFGMSSPIAVQEDFTELMAEGLPEGALLEARQTGRSEVAGTETEGYSFVLDLALLSEWPDAVGMIFGDSPDGAGATADDFLGALSGSMPFEYIVHVDSDDIIRRILVVVDIGAILSQVFGELALADDFPEDAEGAFPEFDYVMSMRMDVVAVNDPSLVVELPDPSLVVELPIPSLGVDLL